MAMAGDPPAATFFWLKCRAGWKEKQEIAHSGPDGNALKIEVTRVGRQKERDVAEDSSCEAETKKPPEPESGS